MKLNSAAVFELAVLQNWATRFNCTVDDFRLPGTVLMPEVEFAGSGAIHIWTIGARAFARMDPAVTSVVDQALGRRRETVALNKALMQAALGPESVLRSEESVLRYLYPPDFRRTEPPDPYVIRTLTIDDADALAAMKSTCTPGEVDMGEVSVDDEIGFGCFDGDRLAAVATGFRLTGFMDIGVLTDPAYRRQGLGKAVVSALCAWCINLPVIPQYRCLTTNVGSYAISQSLGFELTLGQQSIYLKAPQRKSGSP